MGQAVQASDRRAAAASVARLKQREEIRRQAEERQAKLVRDLVEEGGPFRGERTERRAKRMLAVLEIAASGMTTVPGFCISAAREWLAHYRWAQEMRRGRPKQQVDAKLTVPVQVVDNLTGRQIGAPQDIGLSPRPVRALPEKSPESDRSKDR